MDSTELSIPPDIRNLMNSMWADIQRSTNERIERDAAKDPEAFRNTKVMKNTRYTYFQVPGLPKGKSISFCYSKHRNVAGFFLSWAEVWNGKTGYRENFKGWEVKKDAIEYCRMRLADGKKPKPERKFILPDFKKAA